MQQTAADDDYRIRDPRSKILFLILSPVAQILQKLDSDTIRSRAAGYGQHILEAGGFWHGISGYEVLSAKYTFAVMFPLLFLLCGPARVIGGGLTFLVAMMLIAVGYMYPSNTLKARAKERQNRFHRQLPYALDVLRVTAEAGLDLLSSVKYLVDVFVPGPVKEELRLFHKDVQLGKSSVQSLNDLAQRINVPEVSAVFGSLSQSLEMGTGIVSIMKSTAEEMRRKRQLTAQEEANKAVVKITFPLLLLILPGVFIVLFGPIVVDLWSAFGSM